MVMEPTPPSSTSNSTTSASSPSTALVQTALPLNAEMAYLLSIYATGLATWMDIFDHNRSYQCEVPRRCLTSALLTRCVCAFTAKHLSHRASGEVWSSRAVHYYGDSLRLLIQHLDSNPGSSEGDALTANMLLSSYEMLDARDHEHQRHLIGASAFIRMKHINARSRGMDGANFWIYVRHEITISLQNSAPLQLAPDEWDFDFQEGEIDEDTLGNQLMWLCARTVHLLYGSETSPALDSALEDIHREALQWYESLPLSFKAVQYGPTSEIGFSKVYLPVPSASESSCAPSRAPRNRKTDTEAKHFGTKRLR